MLLRCCWLPLSVATTAPIAGTAICHCCHRHCCCPQTLGAQVVAQLNSFLLAAFESTAAAITFCVYFIAQHPEAEARLVQEVGAAAAVANKSKDLSQLDLTQVIDSCAVVFGCRGWRRMRGAKMVLCVWGGTPRLIVAPPHGCNLAVSCKLTLWPCSCVCFDHHKHSQHHHHQHLQLPFTEAVVKEALRLLPPGDIATRSTEQSGLQLTPEVGH